MADKMDRGLDEIIADKSTHSSNGPRYRRAVSDRRLDRPYYPRDGVRKPPPRNTNVRSIDSEWVHDRYEEQYSRRAPLPRRRRESSPTTNSNESRGTKLRVENIHYDLTEDDLVELFTRIGPITRLQLLYDRAGRSEGTAYVTYDLRENAQKAVQQFDGANANGQPIYLTLLSGAPPRNPFDTAVMPGRPLSERITAPAGRSRSFSPRRHHDDDDSAFKGIDRYIPGRGSRSRSPFSRRPMGRRPGVRREPGLRDHQVGRGGRVNPRPRKTQEELDAEMEDYFGGNSTHVSAAEPNNHGKTTRVAGNDDIDMIE